MDFHPILFYIASFRYGEDASVLTENAAYAVGNAALTAHYVGGLGPKSVGMSTWNKARMSLIESCRL